MTIDALDAVDQRILQALQSEGRLTNQALSDRAGLSPSACLARVRRLERLGVIAGYAARLVPARIGLGVTLFAEFTLSRHHPRDFAKFEAAMRAADGVIEVAQISGPYDYLVKIAVPGMAAWIELSDSIMAADLAIAKVTTLVLLKDTKPFAGYPLGSVPRR